MKYILLLVNLFFIMTANHSQEDRNNSVNGEFSFCSGNHIVYYHYDDEDLDESTPRSLYTINIVTCQVDTLVLNSPYNCCAPLDSITCFFSEDGNIYINDFKTQKKTNVITSNADGCIINEMIVNNNTLYFLETDFSTQIIRLKAIKQPFDKDAATILEFPFSELESSKVKLFKMKDAIAFEIQNQLYLYDTITNSNIVISSQVADFAASDNSILYSAYNQTHDEEYKKLQLNSYDITSKNEHHIIELPFKLFQHDLFSRSINGIYQAYYHNGNSLFAWDGSTWCQEISSPFLIYKNKRIEVYKDSEGFDWVRK